ncbi:hypothetical protein [Sedimentitalea nanhaiensis]|uniref:Ig-like domain-containing protein n=1 Tax=Sedimentitalea nanhaiensis TaxID=999627 RepID=A0A1I6ZXE6_9RHOB|nr:hypothetical protein [Sedimentitalea nanhaiensis]SFT67305.1 hypothetical protein SAMN05216236_10542 [Sedimentitalea nanhaiensis]
MKPRIYGMVLVAGLAAIQPVLAQAFTSRSGVRVNPVNAAVFEVVPRSGGGGDLYWCGAADYAQRALKASWQARVYVARAMGPSETMNKRSAVQFTLDPQAAGITPTESSLSINSMKVGESMTVQQGFYYCQKQVPF